MRKKTTFVVQAAIIAAIYVVLTEICSMLGLSSGAIQLRFSEALNVLACFSFSAVPGLFIGCIIANMLAGAVIWDVVFGSLATLIGAYCAYLLRNKRILALSMPVISNAVIVPFVLRYAYGFPGGIPFFVITVAIGEIVSCMVFGYMLGRLTDKYKNILFK